jgi:ABC-2 type transport system ATP-binding protein
VSGFLGPNGAGKSTTMNILTGLIGYNEGQISIDGMDFNTHKGSIMKKVGYLPENPVFYGYMNSFEYLNMIGEIIGYPQRDMKKRIDELLSLVKLNEAGKRRIGGYSRGMKQRLGLAVAMFNNPDVLFLDEPTSALDPEGRMDMMELIDNLKSQGKTVFLSTHILGDVERVCDEVSILNHGEIIISEGLRELENEYIQPIYDIEFEKDCGNIREGFLKFDWVGSVKASENTMSVFVKDISAAKEKLLGEVIKYGNPVVSYNLRKSNLEDIFMRLVK